MAHSSVASLLSLARSLALLIAVLAGVLFLVLLGISFFSLLLRLPVTGVVSAVYCLISAVVNYVAWREIPKLESMAAAGQYRALRDHLLVWVILGILFFVIVGVVLLIALVRSEDLVRPEGSPPPAPASAGATGPPPACPTCGNPTTWIPEYRRFYCYRCSRYV